jgi:LysM repeat protein
MVNYTVVAGDTLFGISKAKKTTIDIIVADNPIIEDNNVIVVGWVLIIRTPQEVAADKAKTAQVAAATSAAKTKELVSKNTQLVPPKLPVIPWDGKEVTHDQTGMVTILKRIRLVSRLENGTFSELRFLNKNEKYRVFSYIRGSWTTTVDGVSLHIDALYGIGANLWVYDLAAYVKFESLPADVKAKSEQPIVATPPQIVSTSMSPTVSYFEPRNHLRPVLQIKKNDSIVTLGMRILGATGNYANQIQATRSNGGWYLNMAGKALMVKTISGIFLDTKTNQEFDDFMEQYDNYLTAYRDGDFYSSAICTLFYKGREYKGLISAFNYSDTETEVLLRRFSMQFLILKEKGPKSGVVTPTNISKSIDKTDDFYSDIRYLLINPISGRYGIDHQE